MLGDLFRHFRGPSRRAGPRYGFCCVSGSDGSYRPPMEFDSLEDAQAALLREVQRLESDSRHSVMGPFADGSHWVYFEGADAGVLQIEVMSNRRR